MKSLFLIIIFSAGCTTISYNKSLPALNFSIIPNNIASLKILKKSKFSGIFTKNYFYYTDSLNFFNEKNILSVTIKLRIPFGPIDSLINPNSNLYVQDSFLYVVNTLEPKISIWKISDTGFVRKNDLLIKNLFIDKNFLLYPIPEQSLYAYNDGYFIPGVDVTAKRSYKYLFVNKEGKKSQHHYYFEVPKEFENKAQRDRSSHLLQMNDSTFFCGFHTSNELALYNIRTQEKEKKITIGTKSDFLKYDVSKNGDISYLRFFDLQNGRNSYQLCDDKIVVLKQFPTVSPNDVKSYKYFVLDNHLNMLYEGNISQSIYPRIIPYGNGFCFLLKQGDELLYYKFP